MCNTPAIVKVACWGGAMPHLSRLFGRLIFHSDHHGTPLIQSLLKLMVFFGAVDEGPATLSYDEFSRQFMAELDYVRAPLLRLPPYPPPRHSCVGSIAGTLAQHRDIFAEASQATGCDTAPALTIPSCRPPPN